MKLLAPLCAGVSFEVTTSSNDRRLIYFEWPIRSRANLRLIRGNLVGRRYNPQSPYEIGLILLLASSLKEGSIFIDIGCNSGWFTVIASRLVGSTGSVYSFEPVPSNLAIILNNILKNKIGNAFISPIALSNKNGIMSLATPPFDDGTGTYLSDKDTGSGTVTRRADDVLKCLPSDKQIVVKIDVEAAEYLVLDGFGLLADRVDTFIVEVSEQSQERFGISFKQVFRLMRERGFLPHRLENDGSICALDEPQVGDIVFIRERIVGRIQKLS